MDAHRLCHRMAVLRWKPGSGHKSPSKRRCFPTSALLGTFQAAGPGMAAVLVVCCLLAPGAVQQAQHVSRGAANTFSVTWQSKAKGVLLTYSWRNCTRPELLTLVIVFKLFVLSVSFVSLRFWRQCHKYCKIHVRKQTKIEIKIK